MPGSVWDDNYLVNKHSDGKIPVSLKKCDIERELRSNGTIREIEEWFSKKREVPRPISRMNISEFRKKNILPHGLDSRKAVNICTCPAGSASGSAAQADSGILISFLLSRGAAVVMRTILRNHVHDDVLELIRHGNLGLIGVEIVDNLLAAV